MVIAFAAFFVLLAPDFVLSTAISTLANREGLTSVQQSEALSPFPIGWTSSAAYYPAVAVATRTTGIVDLLVSLDDGGYVRSVQVVKSTMHDSIGARAIERESIIAAAATTYAQDIVRCRPVAGQYVFTSDFLAK